MIHFGSVRTRLALWFMSVAFLPIVLFALLIYQHQERQIKAEAMDKLSGARDIKVLQVRDWLSRMNGRMRLIAMDDRLRILCVRDRNSQELRSKLEQFAKYLSGVEEIEEIALADASTGQVFSSVHEQNRGVSHIGTSHASDPAFTTALRQGSLHVQGITRDEDTGKPVFTLAMPIAAPGSDQMTAVAIMHVNPEASLYPLLLQRAGLGQSGETYILSRDEIALSDLRWRERAPMSFRISSEPARDAAQGGTGIIETKDYRGTEVLAAYTFIPEVGWGFVAKQDKHEVYAPIRAMRNRTILSAIVAMAIAYILSHILSRTISKPLRTITEVSREIGKGNLQARCDRAGRTDELGALAESINVMADALASRNAVRSAVADLTAAMLAPVDLLEFGRDVLLAFSRATGSQIGALYQREGGLFKPAAAMGASLDALPSFSQDEGQLGLALAGRAVVRLTAPDGDGFRLKTVAGEAAPRDMLAIPLIIRDSIDAVVLLASIAPYSPEALEAAETARPMLATAFASHKAAESLIRHSREIKEKNERLQAQTEELQCLTEELNQQSCELRDQNAELASQRERVDEANRLKSEFIANMSHELRTPLNSVLALSKVLRLQAGERLTEEESRYLEIIHRNGKSLLTLINDILDLSKIEAGKADVRPGRFSVESMLKTVLEPLEPLAAEKGTTLALEIPSKLPLLESDEAKAHHILQNLIGNAVKFTDKGEVLIKAWAAEGSLLVEVTDTGIGIPSQELPHIFEAFRQADGSPSRRFEGTGLGLAIASKYAAMLFGSIHAVSEPGKGSTFTVSLPLAWPGQATDALPGQEDETEFEALPGRDGRRILLADDDQAAIIQVKRVLEGDGYAVDVARSGQEALASMARSLPDGVILDLMMPGMDGFQVLEAMRQEPATATVPVLVLSARTLTKEDMARLLAAKVSNMLQKGDLDQTELLTWVKRMLRRGARPERDGNANPGRSRPLVLVVEDNKDNMTTIKAMLKGRYDLAEAKDGLSGLSLALSSTPDLILTDISMPGMDGYTMIRRLRASVVTHSVPIVVLTAQAMPGDRERALAAGGDAYLAKPVEDDEIFRTIEDLIGRRQPSGHPEGRDETASHG